MSNYCPKGHWEEGMKLPCKQCQIDQLRAEVSRLTAELAEAVERENNAKCLRCGSRLFEVAAGQAVPEWMPRLYSWLARARFENAGDEATATLYGNHLRDLIAAGQRPSQPSKPAKGKEQWLCLLCKSSREGHHGTLDDGVTPCPNGQQKGAQ